METLTLNIVKNIILNYTSLVNVIEKLKVVPKYNKTELDNSIEKCNTNIESAKELYSFLQENYHTEQPVPLEEITPDNVNTFLTQVIAVQSVASLGTLTFTALAAAALFGGKKKKTRRRKASHKKRKTKKQ